MFSIRLCRAAAARPLLASLLLAPGANLSAAESSDADAFQTTLRQEISAGGMVRVKERDPGLIGGGNGGTGTSVNFDDGNLNYGRGFTALAVQGRTSLDGKSETTELKFEAVYFYDFINADGETDFRPLSEEARDRAGRNLYVKEAYAGYKGRATDAMVGVRLGNQILRWSDSPSFGYSIAPVNPVSASRRYQPGNTAKDSYVALPMLSGKIESATRWTPPRLLSLRLRADGNRSVGHVPERQRLLLSGRSLHPIGARLATGARYGYLRRHARDAIRVEGAASRRPDAGFRRSIRRKGRDA